MWLLYKVSTYHRLFLSLIRIKQVQRIMWEIIWDNLNIYKNRKKEYRNGIIKFDIKVLSPTEQVKCNHLFYWTEIIYIHLSSVQSFSHVRLFATLWITALQASLSITNSWSLIKLTSIVSVTPSNHLTLCCPLLLLPSVFPSISLFQWVSSSH